MIRSMKKTYTTGKVKCRDFSDGTKVCASQKAWSVFYASLKKKGLKDTSAPKKFNEAKLIEWFLESKVENNVPRWITLALKILKSDKYNDKIKAYWRKRIASYCKKNPKLQICKKTKINESLEAMNLSKELLIKIAEEVLE